MENTIPTTGIHHLTLTVTDLNRSEEFYSTYLGFQKLVELSERRRLFSNGSLVLALTLPLAPENALPGDQFNENRVGLDHISFQVATRTILENAARLFDECRVQHGEIRDLGEGMGICVMAFRDPDNIQMEFTAPR